MDEVTCLLAAQGALFTGSADNTIKHWNMESNALQATWEGHLDLVTCLLELNGTVFSGSRDRTIRQWDPKDGSRLATLEGHFHGVTCLLAAEGSLLSGAGDRTIRQWDPRDGSLIATLESRTGITCLLDCGEAFFSGLARGYPLRFPPPRMPPGHPGRKHSRADGSSEGAGGTSGRDEVDAEDGSGDGHSLRSGRSARSPQGGGRRKNSNGSTESGSLQGVGRAREVGLGTVDSNAADQMFTGSQDTSTLDKTTAVPPLPDA